MPVESIYKQLLALETLHHGEPVETLFPLLLLLLQSLRLASNPWSSCLTPLIWFYRCLPSHLPFYTFNSEAITDPTLEAGWVARAMQASGRGSLLRLLFEQEKSAFSHLKYL